MESKGEVEHFCVVVKVIRNLGTASSVYARANFRLMSFRPLFPCVL